MPHHNKPVSFISSRCAEWSLLLLLLCCRYGIAADLVQELLPDLQAAAAAAPASLTWPPLPQANVSDNAVAAKGQLALSGLVAVAVWLRLSSLRLLVWNRNYNVKPREISAALDRLGAKLIEVCMYTNA